MVAALIALLILSAYQALQPRVGSIFSEAPERTVFLFDGSAMIDASAPARALLAATSGKGTPWQKLMAFVGPRFPEFEIRLAGLSRVGQFSLASSGSRPMTLLADWRGGLTRITLTDPLADPGGALNDTLCQRAVTEELTTLRETVTDAPLIIWRERDNGDVIWANKAYLLAVSAQLPKGQDLSWPLPRLFAQTLGDQAAPGQRLRLALPDAPVRWYDLHVYPLADCRMMFALPADAAAQAETALKDFVQTLAHLPIGLAIFDRQRKLALFNPALLDLTGLQPDFLSARPTLFAFLDAMRDRQMIPEPKDYKTWRSQMVALEEAAASGQFEETWALPGGQTYRVIGRPHPDGAMALLFEDITAEMSLARRFRADLELGQAVIDTMEEAIAVFSPAGQLVLSNAPYDLLWCDASSTTLTDAGINAICGTWRSQSAPTRIWAEAEAFIVTLGDRTAWTADARLTDGRAVSCRFVPLSGGATLAGFRVGAVATQAAQKAGGPKARRSA